MKKKTYDISKLPKEQQTRVSLSPQQSSVVGVNHGTLIEPIPNIIQGKGEKWVDGANNTAICLGRDRPGSLGSGYGATTGAGQIDIVAGYSSSDIKRSKNNSTSTPTSVSVDPNLSLDAARIMISQKTDVDENFRIAPGQIGNVKNKSAVAIKADSIRIVGREGIKIVTGIDKVNSGGGTIRSVPRIEFLAGNKQGKAEPAALAKTTNKAIQKLWEAIKKLNQELDTVIQHQAEFNLELATHQHYDPMLLLLGTLVGDPFIINDGKVLPSPEVVESAVKHVPVSLIAKLDGMMQQLQVAFSEINITSPAGAANPESRSVRIN